jgi:hypothetical protein
MVLRELQFGGGFARSGNQVFSSKKITIFASVGSAILFCELCGREFFNSHTFIDQPLGGFGSVICRKVPGRRNFGHAGD